MLVRETHDSPGRALDRAGGDVRSGLGTRDKAGKHPAPGSEVWERLNVIVGLAVPCHGRGETGERLVGAGVVVPGSEGGAFPICC